MPHHLQELIGHVSDLQLDTQSSGGLLRGQAGTALCRAPTENGHEIEDLYLNSLV